MTVTQTSSDRPSPSLPLARLVVAVGLPMIGALTVVGTYLGKEVLICAGWLTLSLVGFLFIRPAIGIAVMTGAFLLAAYPTLLQSLGMLTINNLLGICFVGLLGLRILETRDLSFLKIRQVQVFLVIGVLLLVGSLYAGWLFPALSKSVGKMKVLDKTENMVHNFVARFVYLIFFVVFIRDRRDIKTLFVVFMVALYVAIPSALYNMATGTLNRGFRIAASFTSGANPNRLAMICLIEIACWWFWMRARPSAGRQLTGLAAMGAAVMVLFGTGSRSGLLGLGVLGVLLQTSPRRFRVSVPHIGVLVAAGVFAIATIVPPEAFDRMINFSPQKGEVGATSNTMREETLERAWEMFKDYPLFGVGIGNFREVSRQVYDDPFYRPPHNAFLWAASEGGMFVVAAYLVLFWITWKDLTVVTQLAHRDPEIGASAAALRVVCLLYAFFSAFADLWLNPLTYAIIGMVVVMRRYVEGLPEPAMERAVRPSGVRRLAA